MNGLFSQGWTHASINLESSDHNLIRNVHIKSTVLYGERVALDGENCQYNIIEKCFIDNIGATNQINGKNNIFRNNVIKGSHQSPYKSSDTGIGIALSDYDNIGVDNNIIEGNTLINIQQSGIHIGGYGGGNSVSNTTVRNNIFYNCAYNYARHPNASLMVVEAVQRVTNSQFQNNLVISSTLPVGSKIIGYLPPNTDQQNFTKMTISEFEAASREEWSATGTIEEDPLFYSIGGNDLHVQPASPAKEHGISSNNIDDFEGISRHTQPTVGALESW